MSGRLDVYASQPQYVDHLAPVWSALPDQLRGRFSVPRHLNHHARAAGVEPQEINRGGSHVLVAGYGDLSSARRYWPHRALLEHGIGQSYGTDHGAYPGGGGRGDVELFLSPNETAAGNDRARYPQAHIEIVGSPHLDALPGREPGPAPTVAISLHWDGRVAIETRGALGWLRPALRSLVERFSLLGHAHPRLLTEARPVYEAFGIPVVETFAEVCRRADVYVADNTSTLYEFAATGRPVVVLNPPWYRRTVEHGLRFWRAAEVGINVDDLDALPGAIVSALADPPARQAARADALAVVYGGSLTGAADRAAGALQAWVTA